MTLNINISITGIFTVKKGGQKNLTLLTENYFDFDMLSQRGIWVWTMTLRRSTTKTEVTQSSQQ